MSSTLHRADDDAGLRVHTLHDAERGELLELLDLDPLVNAVLASRIFALGGLGQRQVGGETLGVRGADGRLRAVVFAGGNLLPAGGDAAAWQALALHLRQRRRPCSSFVGRADAIGAFWHLLASDWGPARAVRDRQLLLALDSGGPQLPAGDERLRLAGAADFDAYFPAAVAMFTEELGISPVTGRGADYRERVAALLRERRALTITDRHGVLFKADIGALTPRTCQVQGVWVRPDARGHGIGTAAMAGVIRHGLTLAPNVSLYVNDFNDPAVRMYARLGMRHVADLSTVLF